MRVGVYRSNRDVRVEERPVPRIGPGELLVKVWASGICGSDVMEWYRARRAPCVLGHEIGAEVVEVGRGTTDFVVGDRVFVSHHVPCGRCHYCLRDHETVCEQLRSTNYDPGGFAEYVRVPAVNLADGVFRLPDALTYEDAVFIEPLGCAYRGQRRVGVGDGDVVAVLGAGLTGLIHIRLALALGAARVIATDVLPSRREAATRSGAVAALDPRGDVAAGIRERNEGRLADVVIVATGATGALRQAFDCVDRGGSILYFAPSEPGFELPMPFNRVWGDEVTVHTSYGAAPRDIEDAMALLRSGKVRVADLVTHRLPLDRIQEGFRLVAEPVDSIKVIIEPQR